MNVLAKIDRLLNGAQNMAKPTRSPQTVVEYPGDTKGGGLYDAGSRRSPSAPLSKEGEKELHPRIKPRTAPDVLSGVPFPNPAQCAAFDELLRSAGYSMPKDAVAALHDLDKPWLRVQSAITEFASTQSANAAYRQHNADIAARIASGDSTADERDAWTRQDFAEDYRERLMALKLQARKIEKEAWAIAEPVLLAKAQAADEAADELEVEAQKPFGKFAVAYTPPAYVLLLRKYAATLRNGSRENVGKPSSMIETQ